MPDSIFDFRSDTVTRPTAAMRAAMVEAPLGDDVFGDDPTVQRLQERVAQLLGKEAAIFVPSGTMSNLIAVRIHCRPGEEFLCEEGCHIYRFEQGGYAQLNGVAARPIAGVHGVLERWQLEGQIYPEDPHRVRTRAVCLENTHNLGGGIVQPYATVVDICQWAHAHGLSTHLDGARLWNAVVASGIDAARWAEPFDTVNVCFSKGLGAPVGSALAGPRNWIAHAVRHRKLLGGGMRQAGVLAAAALLALDHHVDRLAEDHANAKRLAEGIRRLQPLRLDPEVVETNLVYFRLDPAWGTTAELLTSLRQQGLWAGVVGPGKIRMVTHLDVNREAVERALEILESVLKMKPAR